MQGLAMWLDQRNAHFCLGPRPRICGCLRHTFERPKYDSTLMCVAICLKNLGSQEWCRVEDAARICLVNRQRLQR